MSGTINLVGPSTSPGAPRITPQAINDAVNGAGFTTEAALATEAATRAADDAANATATAAVAVGLAQETTDRIAAVAAEATDRLAGDHLNQDALTVAVATAVGAAEAVTDFSPVFRVSVAAAQADATIPNGSYYTTLETSAEYTSLYLKNSSSSSTRIRRRYSEDGLAPTVIATMPQNVDFVGGTPFYDRLGLYGTARRLYVPNNLRVERNGTNQSFTDIGSLDGVVGTHTGINVPTDNQHYLVWISLNALDANARLKVGTLAAGLPAHTADVIALTSLIGGRFFNNRMGVKPTTGDGAAHPKDVIVVERNGKLYLPGIFASDGGDFSDTDGVYTTLFFEELTLPITSPSKAEPLWVVRDRLRHDNLIYQGRARPAEPFFGEILRRYQNQFSGPYRFIGPEIAGGTTQNLCKCGQNSPELATNMLKRDESCFVVDVVDATANGLGFTKGVQNIADSIEDPLLGSKVWYGSVVTGGQGGYWVFGQVTVLSDTDDNYGSPRFNLWDRNKNGISNTALKLLKQHHSKLWTFAGWGQIPAGEDVYEVTLGTVPAGGDVSGANYTVMGAKFGVAPTKLWVAEDDWGGGIRSIESAQMLGTATGLEGFLVGQYLNMIGGDETHPARPFKWWPRAFLQKRGRGYDTICRLARIGPMDGRLPFETVSGKVLDIDPDLISNGDTIELTSTAMTRGDDGARQQRYLIPVKTDPADLVDKTFKILIVADSIYALAGVAHHAARVLSFNYNCTMVGVGLLESPERMSQGTEPLSGDIVMTQAIGGWRSGDMVGAFDTADTRLPVTDPVAYMALSQAGKLEYNPMVRPLTSVLDETEFVQRHAYKENPVPGEPALRYWDERVAGHAPDPADYFTYDLDFFQTTYSIDTPDVVLYALGANELNDWPAQVSTVDPIARVIESFEVLIASARETWPTVPIRITYANISDTDGMNERWALEDDEGNGRGQVAMLKTLMGIVSDWQAANPGDEAMVELINVWPAMNPASMMFRWSGVANTDGTPGELIVSNEALHPMIGPSREQAGEALAAGLAPIIAALP